MSCRHHACVIIVAAALVFACSDNDKPVDPDWPPVVDLGQDKPVKPKETGPDKPRKDAAKPKDMPKKQDKKPTTDTKLPDKKLPPDKPITGTGPYRVATFNAYCLKDSPAKRAVAVAAEIKKLNLDAVGLQEVCQTASSGGSDHFGKTLTAELKKATGQDWEYRWAKTHLAWSTYDEGVGVVARKGAIKSWGEKKLYKPGSSGFQRKVIWAKVATPRGAFYIYSTHLGITSSSDRTKQAQDILALVKQHATPLPQVVMGDFNDFYASGAVNTIKNGPPQFVEAWGTKHPGSSNPGLTCCRPTFKSRIDYILIKKSTLSNLTKVTLAFDINYLGVWLSDHRGVFAEFWGK